MSKKPYFDADLIRRIVDEVQLHYGLQNLPSKRKASTNGGEYEIPCPHCRMQGHSGGENRLVIWVNRPVVGGAPCFFCRQCGGDGRFSTKWTGDLPHFLMDTMGMTFPEALDYLEIPDEYRDLDSGSQVYAPRHRTMFQKAPALAYQQKALEILAIAEANLWSDRGSRRREQLQLERGLNDKVIKFARIGFNPQKQFFNASEWGLEGDDKIMLDRGFVIPDFQYNMKTKQFELWSIVVRRLIEDIKMDILKGIKDPHRYSVVGRGVRGLYLSHTMLPDESGQKKPLVLCSGPFDPLAVLTATDFKYAAVATQTDRGAQYPQWINMIKEYATFTIIIPDNDESGMELARYWSEQLGDQAIVARIKGFKDPSEMHSNGNDMLSWLDACRHKYIKHLYLIRNKYATPEPQEQAQVEVEAVTVLKKEEPALSAKIEAIPSISDQNDSSKSNQKVAVAEKCQKCGRPYKYEDVLGNKWCSQCFSCVQLMNFGVRNRFETFEYPAGYGLVNPLIVDMAKVVANQDIEANPCPGFEYREGGRVPSGRISYKNFCYDADPASIWLAARQAFRIMHGYKAPKNDTDFPHIIKHPCANKNCRYDRKEPHYPEGRPYIDTWGKKQWPNDKEGPAYYGLTTWPGTSDQLEWCPRCSSNHKFLLLCEELGYPGLQKYTAYPLAPGKKAAIEYAISQSAFAITNMYDLLLFELKNKSA